MSPPLILTYFGNKDTLFARVMSFETDADPLLRIVFAPLHGEAPTRACAPNSPSPPCSASA